jgi:hypothetical protein
MQAPYRTDLRDADDLSLRMLDTKLRERLNDLRIELGRDNRLTNQELLSRIQGLESRIGENRIWAEGSSGLNRDVMLMLWVGTMITMSIMLIAVLVAI